MFPKTAELSYRQKAESILEYLCVQSGCEKVSFSVSDAVVFTLSKTGKEIFLEHFEHKNQLFVAIEVVLLSQVTSNVTEMLITALRYNWEIPELNGAFFAYDEQKRRILFCKWISLDGELHSYNNVLLELIQEAEKQALQLEKGKVSKAAPDFEPIFTHTKNYFA